MTHSIAARLSRTGAYVALIGGSILLTSSSISGQRGFDGSASSSANAATPLIGPDVAICHTPMTGTAISAAIKLAQTRTEVPKTEMQAATPAPAFADIDPPLWDGLGAITYKVTTSSSAAQSYFDQGMRLLYAFNHGEAQRAFRKAQKLDPTCAMCFWGEALVLGPNINLPMQEDAVAPAFKAVQRALALSTNVSPREQALIVALATRYMQETKTDRAPLDAPYAAAMGKLAADFPDDNEIALL